MSEWITRTDENNPTVEGLYAVMVAGDSEYLEGHLMYAYNDYQTFATFKLDEEGEGRFTGEHDEEDSSIIAYFGPIVIPTYEAPDV